MHNFKSQIDELARKARPTTAGEVRRLIVLLCFIAAIVFAIIYLWGWLLPSSISSSNPTPTPAQETQVTDEDGDGIVDAVVSTASWLTGVDSKGGLTFKKLGGTAIVDFDTKDVLDCKGEIPYSCTHTLYSCVNVNLSELFTDGDYTQKCLRTDSPENRSGGTEVIVPECQAPLRLHFSPIGKEYSCK